jgi:VWFA-related protein
MVKVKVYLTCLAYCLCCFITSYDQAQAPSGSPPVKVLLTAVDAKGTWVNDPSPPDLRLIEDGRPLPISDIRAQVNPPTSVAVMIDTSSSQDRFFPLVKSTARVFVKGFIRPGKDMVSITSFAEAVAVRQNPTDDVRMLHAAISSLEASPPFDPHAPVIKLPKGQKPRGSTALWDAIIFVCEKALPSSAAGTRKAIVLFTDGDDDSSSSKMRDAIESAAKNDVAVFAVGIPYRLKDADMKDTDFDVLEREKLRKLAEDTGGRAYFPDRSDDLELLLSQIERDLRSQYVISFQPGQNTGRGTRKRLKIEVVSPERRKENIQLSYRRTY